MTPVRQKLSAQPGPQLSARLAAVGVACVRQRGDTTPWLAQGRVEPKERHALDVQLHA